MGQTRPMSGEAAAGGRGRAIVGWRLLGVLLAGGFGGSARPWAVSGAGAGPATLASPSLGRSRRGGRLDHAVGNHDKVHIDLEWLASDHARMRRDPAGHEVMLKFRADDRHFDLRLKHDDSVFADGFHVAVHKLDGTIEKVQLDRANYLAGVVAGYGPHESHVTAIIEDGHLAASITMGKRFYRLEPAHKYGVESDRHNHVVYSKEDVSDPTPGACGTVTDGVNGKAAVDLWPAPDASTMGHEFDHGQASNQATNQATNQADRSDGGAGGFAWGRDDTDLEFDIETSSNATGDPVQERHRREDVDVSIHNTCIMHLLADKFFFQNNAGSVTATSNMLVAHLTDVNTIYKFTSFDGVAAKIKLAIGKLTIFEADDRSQTGESSPFVTTTIAQTYLNSLSSLSHTSYCLAHGFTHQDFDGGILGLAYVGVICQTQGEGCAARAATCSRNTGITTSLNYEQSSYIRTTLVLAHEVGHNFGMSHDDSCATWCATQPSGTCTGSDVTGGNAGNYIMWPSAVDGNSPNNDRFSGCSRASAGSEILQDAGCFRDLDNSGYCGNGVVEANEECDCGVSTENVDDAVYIAACTAEDPCCNTNCTLKSTSSCSPKKGECCTAGCELKGLALDFMDIDTFQPTNKIATAVFESVLFNDFADPNEELAANAAIKAAFLVANSALSADNIVSSVGAAGGTDNDKYAVTIRVSGPEAVSITLSAAVLSADFAVGGTTTTYASQAVSTAVATPADVTEHLCRDPSDCQTGAYCVLDEVFLGACPEIYHPHPDSSARLVNITSSFTFFRADKTICGNNRASCLSGDCRGSLCTAFTGNVGSSASACPLTGASDCVIGCEFPGVTGCMSSYDFGSNTDLATAGYSFPADFAGQIKVPGTACDGFTGYCNVDGTCEAVSSDSPLDALFDLDVQSWIWDNWWIVLCIEAGIVAFMFVLRWSKQKKDTSQWIHSQWSKDVKAGIGATILKAFTKGKTRKMQKNTKKLRREAKRKQRKELAMVLGESRHLAHAKATAARAKKGEAFSRLKCLFPYSPDDVVRQMIRLCPNEEAAVARMLVLGHPMWKIEDYKTLHYAIRRHKKGQTKQGSPRPPTDSPNSGKPKPTVRVQARGYGTRRSIGDPNAFSPLNKF